MSESEQHMKTRKQELLDAAQNGNIQKVKGLISSGVEVNNYDAEFPESDTPLIKAIKNSHVQIVKFLLHSGASIQECNENIYWPIHVAAQEGCEEIVEILLAEGDIGVQLQAKTMVNETPLMIASIQGHTSICQLMMKYGPANGPLDVRKQLLWGAAENGDLQKVQDLISSGAEVNNYEEFPYGRTPLIKAIRGKNEEIAKLLLQNGASHREYDEFNFWPIHFAAQKGYDELVELLLVKGDIAVQLQAKTDEHHTPLMFASQNGHTLICQIIMKHGPDNICTESNKQLLWGATQNGDLQIVQDLISCGVELNNYADFPSSNTPLIQAIWGQNEEIVKILLQNGASVQEYDVYHYWPIHIAAQEGCEEIVELLLGQDIDAQLQARTNLFETPLMIASQNGHTSIFNLLMKHGAGNGPLDTGKQLLWDAAQNLDINKALELISSGVDVNNYAEFPDGETPLIKAISFRDIEMMKLLLQNGASLQECTTNQFLPIHIAAQMAEGEEMVEVLLAEGDINAQLQSRTKFHETPLMIASRMGHIPTCQLLMKLGPASVTMESRKKELLRAARKGDLHLVQELISSGVEVNNYSQFPQGLPPLSRAIFGKHVDMVKLLLQNGASVQGNDEEQYWPIHIAAGLGCEEIVALLLGEGDINAQIQARTNSHSTPLLIASQKGHISTCQLLIHHGADVNAVEETKSSSLMGAAGNGHVSTIELLLKNGADPRTRNIYGESALSQASALGHIDVVHILLPLMSMEDLMKEDEEGNTAAFNAAKFAKFEIMELILKKGNGKQIWRSSKSTIFHFMIVTSLSPKYCHQFKELIQEKDSDGFTPAQFALRMNQIENFNTLVQYKPQLLKSEGFNLMKLALQYAHPEVVDLIPKGENIMHKNNDWLLYLTSNAGKSQERRTIFTKHTAMFKRKQNVKEAIANTIKNNHLDILKTLMEWTKSPSELASIWPLWTAIDVGNDDIALYLLQLDSLFQYQTGPDKSLPLQLCLLRDNYKILAAWKDQCPDMVQTLTQSDREKNMYKERERTEFKRMCNENNWNESQFVSLSKTYPLFNQHCSLPFKVPQYNENELSFTQDILSHSIDVSACIPKTRYDHKHCAGHIGSQKILACEILTDLVRYIFAIEDELNKKGNLMETLGPNFVLIGSIPEGTRLGHPDELDMSTMFNSIEPNFFELNSSNAFGLKLSEKGVAFFTKVQEQDSFQKLNLPCLIMKGNMFNVLAFQQFFLTTLQQAIPRVELPKNVQLGTSNSVLDITKCERCVIASEDEGTWMHCSKCFPLFAQSKRGVVLNLLWSNKDVEYKCSIDLVPMYPVPEKDLSKLFGSVFQTLIDKKPAGWRGFLDIYVHIDRPVHGTFVELAKKSSKDNDRPLLIVMKVLNYGPGSNYIQCPGQSTGLDYFSSRRIREAYLFTKGLIKLLDLPVKSYYLKKMFLDNASIDISQTARNNQHFILFVLCQPEWGTLFTDRLDMDKMEEEAHIAFSSNFEAYLKFENND